MKPTDSLWITQLIHAYLVTSMGLVLRIFGHRFTHIWSQASGYRPRSHWAAATPPVVTCSYKTCRLPAPLVDNPSRVAAHRLGTTAVWRYALILIVVLFWPNSGWSASQIQGGVSAASLYEACTSNTEMAGCYAYINGWVAGYETGVAYSGILIEDLYTDFPEKVLLSMGNGDYGLCIPDNFSVKQMMMIFKNFMQANPKYLHRRSAEVLHRAFREAFPAEADGTCL